MSIPLFDGFVKFKGYDDKTKSNNRTYLGKNVLEGLSNPNLIEKNYLDIVAFSIAAKRKDLAVDLIKDILKKNGSKKY